MPEEVQMNVQTYQELLDGIIDGVYLVDVYRRITYWNKGAAVISGFSQAEMIGRYCYDNLLQHVDEAGQHLCEGLCPLAKSIEDGQPREAHIFLHHADGHRVPVWVRVAPVRDEEGKIIGGVEIFSRNPAAMAVLEKLAVLEKEAYQDPLTGVGNRRYIEMKLESALHEFTVGQVQLGVILIDIDKFKEINDRYGHDAGDLVLKVVAATLVSNLRAYDSIGRWGGDEFIVVMPNLEFEKLQRTGGRLRALVSQSAAKVDGEEISTTISMGAAMAREGDSLKSLVARADEQLYISKREGRNRFSSTA